MQQFQNDMRIKEHIRVAEQQKSKSRTGIVVGYTTSNNTATVALTASDSEQITDILHNVPCPVQLGLQTVAPEPGMFCWVVFTGQDEKAAVITHFYNHFYQKYNYASQSRSDNTLPSFMLNG